MSKPSLGGAPLATRPYGGGAMPAPPNIFSTLLRRTEAERVLRVILRRNSVAPR